MKADIKVLDDDICSKCRLMEVRSFPIEYYANDQKILSETRTECTYIGRCKYLKQLFESASQTTPKVEDVNP